MKLATVLFALIPLLSADPFRAGRAQTDITPPTGMPMAGYYYVRLNEGVHDPLHAKAIVIEKDGVRAALVALDLVGVPRAIVEAARDEIGRSTRVPGANVMISATHSHTGPEMGGRLRGVDAATERIAREYMAGLPKRIAESVRLAEADLQPARVRTATGFENSVSFVRRFFMKDGTIGWNPGKRNPNIVKPTSEIDPAIPIVSFETAAGKPLAIYVNFACHLDTVGGMQFSADYAYTLSRLLADVKGADVLTVFTIGTAGNINHIDVSSPEPQKGHVEAARIGTILAGDVLRAWRKLKEIDPAAIRVSSEMVPLPLAEYKPEDLAEARRIVANYGKPNADPFLKQVYAFKVLELEERHGKPIEAEVQAIALGRDIAWIGMPGEIFVEHGKAVKIASPFPQTIIAELANASIGYIPDRRAYPQGAYEVVSSRVAAGGGEKMAESAVRQLIQARAR